MEHERESPTPTTDSSSRPTRRPDVANFVGRVAEMAALIEGVEGAIAGRGRLFLVPGEPGIGKSRLADELAVEARRRGARVLWGRCWEAGGAPAYWPWVQSIRSHIRDAEPDAIREEIGAGAPDLARMLPEIRNLFEELPEPAAVDAETARFRLFDATARLLTRASVRRPLVLILDDLHAADAPSLLFLRFLGSELPEARIVVMGAYRDTELTPDHPLTTAVIELARLPVTQRMPLLGITESEVASLIRLATGEVPSEEVVAAVHGHTDGNPLFVSEVVHLLASEGRLPTGPARFEVAVPAGVRGVIARQLRRLSERCAEILTLAAVLGREFDLSELEWVSGLSSDPLLGALEEAASLRVIEDVPGILGRLRFSHALVRDALYEEISAARRIRLHGRVGNSLEELYGDDPEGHLTELAHHFVLAAPGGEVDRAVTYARRSGERALRLLAYEEAARLFTMGLEALELRRPVDERTRCDLLLAVGDARARAGDERGAKATFLEAADVSAKLGEGDMLARAALGYGGRFVWARAGTDRHVVRLLRQALDALPEGDSSLRVRVMARLAGALRDEPEREPRTSLSEQALDMARGIGDQATLAYALDGRYAVLLWPENADERIGMADELRGVAEGKGDLEKGVQARCYRAIALLELGDLVGVRAELSGAHRLAERLGQRAQLWLVSAMRATVAIFQGAFPEAERLVEEALAFGQGAQRSDAVLSHRIHAFSMRRFRGGLEAFEETLRRSVDEYPRRPMFRCMLALLYAEAGRAGDAHRLLDLLGADGFSVVPRSNEWLFSLSMLAEVAGLLGDAAPARSLYDLLLPHPHLNGATADYIATGPVSRYLGILATVLGLWDEGERWFAMALEAGRRMGARPYVAYTLKDEARMLLARAEPTDPERAAALLSEAREIGRDLAMKPLVARVEGLLPSGPEGARPREHVGPGRGPVPNVFLREGDYWTIAFDADAFRLRDLKGLRYIARLLAEPGREFHALDLVVSAGGARVPAPTRRSEPGLEGTDPADAGTLLDPQAKAEYRRRLRDMEEEIEEARSLGDSERAAGLEEERDFLVRELGRAVGLGGRDRRGASSSERARVSVTQAIRTALARIREQSPALGDHLDRTIRTGIFCTYDPDPRALVDWRT